MFFSDSFVSCRFPVPKPRAVPSVFLIRCTADPETRKYPLWQVWSAVLSQLFLKERRHIRMGQAGQAWRCLRRCCTLYFLSAFLPVYRSADVSTRWFSAMHKYLIRVHVHGGYAALHDRKPRLIVLSTGCFLQSAEWRYKAWKSLRQTDYGIL